MGNVCEGEIPTDFSRGVQMLPARPPSDSGKYYKKSSIHSIRFGEVQKIRCNNILQNNKYKYFLPLKNTDQFIEISVPIVTSYADEMHIKSGILKGTNVNRNKYISQIIDTLDLQSDSQIYHNYSVEHFIQGNGFDEGEKEMQEVCVEVFAVKVYNFKNQHDVVFKNALYELSLYMEMEKFHNLPFENLRDSFIFKKGQSNSFVFVHNFILCTLFDILQYRQLANLPYNQSEQNYIACEILKQYRNLKINNIVHRDIRPSKIYLCDPGFIYNSEGKRVQLKGGKTSSQNLGYQLINLQSARKYKKQEKLEKKQNSLLQTVRGVPIYCQQELQSIHEGNSQLGTYNAIFNDRVQLGKLFVCIMTLEPYFNINEQGSIRNIKLNQLRKKNAKLTKVVEKLFNNSQESDSIENLIKQISFHHKIVHSIIQSDHKIAVNLLPKLFYQAHQQRIQNSRLQAMFFLHQRDQITKVLSQKLEENYKDEKYYQNVEILERVGKYYEGIGVKNNDYYREQVNLLLEIVEQERIKGFEIQDILEKAQQIYNEKLSESIRTPITLIKLAVQNGYLEMDKNNKAGAMNNANLAMKKGAQISDISISLQLKILQAKGTVQQKFGDEILAEEMFDNGLKLCSDQRNFPTQVQKLQMQSNFQYLKGSCLLEGLKRAQQQERNSTRLKQSQLNRKVRTIGKCDSLLKQSKNTKIQVPGTNTVKLGKVYEKLGDLSCFNENYEEGIGYYERTFRLYQTNEGDYNAADVLKLQILQKMQKIYHHHLPRSNEEEDIKNKIRQLKKNIDKDKKDPRSNFAKLKNLSLKQKSNKAKIFNDSRVIDEESQSEEENMVRRD